MFGNKTLNHTRIFQLTFFFLGILTVALGFYATGPRLIQFALHFSPDKTLDEQAIAVLHGFTIRFVLLGTGLILLAMVAGYIVQCKNSIIRKIESDHLIERWVSFMGRLLDLAYRVGTNEKFLWSFLILILTSSLLSGIFLSLFGGFHVEGIDLQPPKNLARHGIYATLTTEGFDDVTHRISAGPGILLPNALVFTLFGINVYYSRALYAAFFVAAVIAFYHVARSLYGKKVALLALFLFLFSSGTFLGGIMERGIMGGDAYTPAIFYFLTGALFWFKAIDTKKNIYLITSGLLWGLSFQTQWLFLFAIFAMIITSIILRLSKNGLGSKYYLIPSGMVFLVTIAWFSFRILNVGLRQELKHLSSFWGEHGHRAIGVSIEGVASSIFALVRPIVSLSQTDLWGDFQLFLMIPAVLYIIILIGRSKMTDYKSLFFLSFTLVWFSWWLVFNYDLPKTHLRTVVVMSQLFIAKLLVDMWEYSSTHKDTFGRLMRNPESRQATMAYLIRVVIVCIVLGKVFLPLAEKGGTLYTRYGSLTKPYKEMMTYISQNTEKDAVFSGWDWSMPWYVDLDEKGDHIIKDRATYRPDQREPAPEYFIVSPEWPLLKVTEEWPSVTPENPWTTKDNERRKKFLAEQCTLIRVFGGEKHKWLLYRVNNETIGQLPKKEPVSEVSERT